MPGKREANVPGVDRGGDDVLPALIEEGPRKLGVLDSADREDDVIRGHRGAVRPARVGAHREAIAAAVRADLPARGKPCLDRAGGQDADEWLEEQRIEVIGTGRCFAEQRVQRAELTDHTLHVGAAGSGRFGGQDGTAEHEHENCEEHEQQHASRGGEQPAPDQTRM